MRGWPRARWFGGVRSGRAAPPPGASLTAEEYRDQRGSLEDLHGGELGETRPLGRALVGGTRIEGGLRLWEDAPGPKGHLDRSEVESSLFCALGRGAGSPAASGGGGVTAIGLTSQPPPAAAAPAAAFPRPPATCSRRGRLLPATGPQPAARGQPCLGVCRERSGSGFLGRRGLSEPV